MKKDFSVVNLKSIQVEMAVGPKSFAEKHDIEKNL